MGLCVFSVRGHFKVTNSLMLKNLYTKLTGDPNEKEIKRLSPLVVQINEIEPEFSKLTDSELTGKTAEFKARIAESTTKPRQELDAAREQLKTAADEQDRRLLGEHVNAAQKELVAAERVALDEILPEAFAAVREASVRTIGLRHFDVQMIGGMVLHSGKVAEMRTGEGKTLVATLPLYLNALAGHGAHLVTVNDYLARRDAQWMGPIYHLLGLSVGVLQQGEKNALLFNPEAKANTPEMDMLQNVPRHDAYAADITYGTNNEFGFDYLRDNMAWRLEDRVQRELHYAIVDEVDNILIDEARTPLIISGPAGEASDEYYRLADVVRKLNKDHYEVDARTRAITLTEAGFDRVEELLGTPLYNVDRPEEVDPNQAKLMHHLEAAMKAEYLFKRDKDYIIRKGEVIIVDEFTGRTMPGRRWSDGLHQAVEAKERVPIQQESVTYATITLQNYFRLYKKLAGMTGTAKTEEDEFQKVYGLDVITIPTHKPMVRADQPDLVYRNEEAKWRAVTIEIASLYAKGQPTLVGTTSVELSERLSLRLAAPKLQTLARVRLLTNAVDASKSLTDKQRGACKSLLGRSLDDAPENYDEALSSRLFHDYDVRAIADLARRLKQPARELARVKPRLGRDKDRANLAKQFGWSDKELREMDGVGERDLRFAAHMEERQMRLDNADALCTEIATHPDDLAKIAPRFNLPLQPVLDVYQDLRLSRSEMVDINRALVDSCGDVESVTATFSVRAADMDVILKRLFLRDDDVLRLAKKLQVDADPFAEENRPSLREALCIADDTQLETILREGVPHSVLNAKEHDKEGRIIARAGEPHTITIATNMAGRGVDIKLGGELTEETLNEVGRILHRSGIDPYDLTYDQILDAVAKIPEESYALDKEYVDRFVKYMHDRARVRELGGLRIIGTERHEARRIDNQLRGRSGRQGDPGSSRFYVSLEDEIMRRMGGKGLVDRVWIEDIPIEHSWVTGAIEQAQVKMESYNFDIRKHLLEYDDVLNKQREVIYGQRYRILTKEDLREDLRSWLEAEVARVMAEDLKGENGESRLLFHLDALLPGFFLGENEIWPPFSLSLVQRDIETSADAATVTAKILEAARRAMELHRDYITQVVVPDVINQFETDYKMRWSETEDLAKNTLATAQQEAQEQNLQLDPQALLLTVSQAVGIPVDVRVERGSELSERDIVATIHRAFDVRVADQIARRVEKRIGTNLPYQATLEQALDFGTLRDSIIQSVNETYDQQADRYLVDIERELAERVKTKDDVSGLHLSNLMFGISNTRHAMFDQRTHRRYEIMVPRFPWSNLAADKIQGATQEETSAEILDYWNRSLDQLEPLRGGAAAFNDSLRELMLSVVTNLWVDYLTEIEALREGIGLQAFGQRDPLVEYKRRAYDMFQDLYQRIRSQVVRYVFTYQYRGFAKLEHEDRDRASRQAIQETPADKPALAARPGGDGKRTQPAEPKAQKPAPARTAVQAAGKLGRNDPCWCGSGKKYKNCHMQTDLGAGAPTPAGGAKKRRR